MNDRRNSRTPDGIEVVHDGNYIFRLERNTATSDRRASDALLNGTYYARIREVWNVRPESPRPDYAQYICRRTTTTTTNGLASYELNARAYQRDQFADAWNETFLPVVDCTAQDVAVASSGSLDTTVRENLWPVTIFGYPVQDAQIAHFIPTSMKRAMTWWFIADIMFGGLARGPPRQWTWKERQMLINGALDGSDRRAYSGIKHMCTNKARITGQLHYMDQNPCVLIVPIMTPKRAREWRGEAFNAIVMIDSIDEERALTPSMVARRTDMNEIGWCDDLAWNAEIDRAGALLRMTMLLIRHYVTNPPHDIPDNVYTDGAVRKDVTPPTAENNNFFMVPFVRSSDHLRVRKIQFSAATSWDDAARDANGEQIEWEGRRARKHMAPDPLLLLARAALVFSSRHRNKFAAGAEEPPEDDDWRHQYEEERFADYLQSTLRPPDDPIELARALGQAPRQSASVSAA